MVFDSKNHTQLGAGINLKPQHYNDALDVLDPVLLERLWFEVHTENYFVAGGPRLSYLQAIAEKYPLSFHGVGGSLGSFTKEPYALTQSHLTQVVELVKRFNPILVSEHATWSTSHDTYFADLLPLPRTQVALSNLCDGIDRYQNAIGRSILVENPTNYLHFVADMDEADFLMEAIKRTGAGLLLDVNNLYLSARNTGIDPITYLNALDPERVGEIHIAGFDTDKNFPDALLIDSHGAPVDDAVWQLLDTTLKMLGSKPVLLERDDNIPSFQNLLTERNQAQHLIQQYESLEKIALGVTS